MAVARTEPRGLTLLDLMVLVAGVAFVLSLPRDRYLAKPIQQIGFPAERAAAWLEYLEVHLGRFCLVPGLVAIARSARYRRPIQPPEFLALCVGWVAFLGAIRLPRVGWVNLYTYTGVASYHLNPLAALRWESTWFAAGCVGAACLAIGPIRRRLPAWLRPILLVLGWYALVGPLDNLLTTYVFRSFPRAVHGAVLGWGMVAVPALLLLPVAASLAGLHPRSRDHWTLMAWLALPPALAARVCWPAYSFLSIFIRKNVGFGSPESRQQHILDEFIYPPLILALETAFLLTWFLSHNRLSREEPTVSTHPILSTPPYEQTQPTRLA